MNITVENPDADIFVKHYTPGKISLNTEVVEHSVIIHQDKVVEWAPATLASLNKADIKALLAFEPSVIIMGTGAEHVFPAHDLLAPVYDKHIGLEIMTTEAACRTFNILADEGRDVLAALIIK